MIEIAQPLYVAEATVTGGREGRATTKDGKLDLKLSMPKSVGGSGGEGTNPEELFAAGYAACFQSALGLVARKAGKSIEGSTIHALTTLGKTPAGGFGLKLELRAKIPGLDKAAIEDLLHKAHEVCPYSNATRGNLDVKLTAE